MPDEVWLLEVDCYENRFVEGVYRSAEAAKAAFAKDRTGFRFDSSPDTRPIAELVWTWHEAREEWTNNGDWSDSASIMRYPVEAD